jgi:hypothetical protein
MANLHEFQALYVALALILRRIIDSGTTIGLKFKRKNLNLKLQVVACNRVIAVSSQGLRFSPVVALAQCPPKPFGVDTEDEKH